MSPTITSPAVTPAGMILGTAAYMSPEQARGKTVDKRADVSAFGVVLYEMLTGTRLFAGDSVPETLGLIFSCEPDLALLPAATPARVRTLIARCLVKDPRQRLLDIGDARLDLEDARDAPAPAAPIPVRSLWRALPWGIAAATVLLAGWTLWGRPGTGTTGLPVTHLEIGFSRDVEPSPSSALGPAITSDGRSVAMIGVSDGVRRAFVRRLDRPEAIALPGGAANGIVFSPDGGSVAVVYSSGLITRISLADRQRKDLTSGADVTGGIAWSQAGIVFGRGARSGSSRRRAEHRACSRCSMRSATKWRTTGRSCCPGSASCCLRVRPPSQAASASNPCRSTEDRGRWWLSERRPQYGRPRATCSSRGTVLCWRWRSTRARQRRVARPYRFWDDDDRKH